MAKYRTEIQLSGKGADYVTPISFGNTAANPAYYYHFLDWPSLMNGTVTAYLEATSRDVGTGVTLAMVEVGGAEAMTLVCSANDTTYRGSVPLGSMNLPGRYGIYEKTGDTSATFQSVKLVIIQDTTSVTDTVSMLASDIAYNQNSTETSWGTYQSAQWTSPSDLSKFDGGTWHYGVYGWVSNSMGEGTFGILDHETSTTTPVASTTFNTETQWVFASATWTPSASRQYVMGFINSGSTMYTVSCWRGLIWWQSSSSPTKWIAFLNIADTDNRNPEDHNVYWEPNDWGGSVPTTRYSAGNRNTSGTPSFYVRTDAFGTPTDISGSQITLDTSDYQVTESGTFTLPATADHLTSRNTADPLVNGWSNHLQFEVDTTVATGQPTALRHSHIKHLHNSLGKVRL